MQEFEPKKRTKILTKEFLAKYAYVLVLGLILIGGISYGYTFFIQNKRIASGSITTAALTINFTDRNISASSLSVPNDNQEGLSEYSKSVTITNQTAIDGRVKLTLTRTSGLDLTDMSYALIVNGAIQEIDDVPANGEILETAIMGGSPTGETINLEIRLWPKTTYTGSETTFVGELTPEVKYLGNVASNISSPAGKYVNFNCSSTCEVWQIVKVEDDRLVLTRQADYTNATSRTNSNRYNPSSFNPVLTFNDDSLIYSLSTDGKNVYLAKTVKVTGGSGTQADPYNLANEIFREDDKKVQAVITYKDSNNTNIGTQNIYYNETNYISQTTNEPGYNGWDDGTNDYILGDTISFTSDMVLQLNAVIYNIQYNLDGGTVSSSNPTQYTVLDSNFQLNNPAKTGYVFAGWSGTELTERTLNVTLDTSIVEDCTFTANWKKQIDNNLWYGGDHLGSFISLPITVSGCSINDFLINKVSNKITVYANVSGSCSGFGAYVWTEEGSPTWFDGTTTSTTVDGRSFNRIVSSTYTTDSSRFHTHIYKIPISADNYFTEIKSYKMDGTQVVNYNGNGGIVQTASTAYYPGFTVNISNSNATRSGYTMLGWSEDTDGDIYTLYKMQGNKHPAEDITLYAQWVKNSNL